MNQPATSAVNFGTIVTTFKRRWYLWVTPTVLATLMALTYALIREPQWQASQALLVRDETGSETDRQGRFVSAEVMKAFQETIQEVARHQAVVADTLRQLGPPPNYRQPDQWPTERDVETARGRIRVGAPNGAEFGRTEVIYLTVSAGSRPRAQAFCGKLCDTLDERLRRLRDEKASSMIAELERTLTVGRQDLEKATARLQALEQQVGTDLGELRILADAGAGESNLRSSLTQLEAELRQAETALRSQQQQERLLNAAQNNPDRLLVTPNHLLETQPALRRLKDGLIDSQLRTAELMGMMNPEHPNVRSAKTAEERIRRELHAELDVALQGLAAEREVSRGRVESLNEQLADVRGRLDRLAGLRAQYSNLVADVRQRSRVVDRIRTDLGNARASQSGAQTASLMTRVDAPLSGEYPVGPSRTAIVMGGCAGGLATGLGLLFLVTPLGWHVGQMGRRWTDRIARPWGRRQTDTPTAQQGARRESNCSAPTASERRRTGDQDSVPQAPAPAGDPVPQDRQRDRRTTDQPFGRRAEDRSCGRRTEDPPTERRADDRPTEREGAASNTSS
jgi:uncharacterized protein involved in exopolysaccharide biosynthesis